MFKNIFKLIIVLLVLPAQAENLKPVDPLPVEEFETVLYREGTAVNYAAFGTSHISKGKLRSESSLVLPEGPARSMLGNLILLWCGEVKADTSGW